MINLIQWASFNNCYFKILIYFLRTGLDTATGDIELGQIDPVVNSRPTSALGIPNDFHTVKLHA